MKKLFLFALALASCGRIGPGGAAEVRRRAAGLSAFQATIDPNAPPGSGSATGSSTPPSNPNAWSYQKEYQQMLQDNVRKARCGGQKCI